MALVHRARAERQLVAVIVPYVHRDGSTEGPAAYPAGVPDAAPAPFGMITHAPNLGVPAATGERAEDEEKEEDACIDSCNS